MGQAPSSVSTTSLELEYHMAIHITSNRPRGDQLLRTHSHDSVGLSRPNKVPSLSIKVNTNRSRKLTPIAQESPKIERLQGWRWDHLPELNLRRPQLWATFENKGGRDKGIQTSSGEPRSCWENTRNNRTVGFETTPEREAS